MAEAPIVAQSSPSASDRLSSIEVIGGVSTHVVEEREQHDGQLAEVSRNYFVEASDGTVCYYGERGLKVFARGVGLVIDGTLELVSQGS